MNAKSLNGNEAHPLEHLHFFESEFSASDLNGEKVHLEYVEGGWTYAGIFTMFSWNHPRLPKLLAIRAQGHGVVNAVPTVFTITFDSIRANKISKTTSDRYAYKAVLGELRPLEQVPEIWKLVRADFDREVEKITPSRAAL